MIKPKHILAKHKFFSVLFVSTLIVSVFAQVISLQFAPQATAATMEEMRSKICTDSRYKASGELEACKEGWNAGYSHMRTAALTGDPKEDHYDNSLCYADELSSKEAAACGEGYSRGFDSPLASDDDGPQPTNENPNTVKKPPASDKAGTFCYKQSDYAKKQAKYDACVRGYKTTGLMPATCAKESHYIVCSKGWGGMLKATGKVAPSTDIEDIWHTCVGLINQFPEGGAYDTGGNNSTTATSCIAGYMQPEINSSSGKTAFCSRASMKKEACELGWDLRDLGQNELLSRAEAVAGSAADSDNCDVKIKNPLSWFVCPAIDLFGTAIDTFDGIIYNQLTVGSEGSNNNPSEIFCDGDSKSVGVKQQDGSTKSVKPCDAYESAWRAVRNVALGLMVIAGLVMIIAQMMGTEIVDAYTIRKVLPRVLVAAIGITLSWEIMGFLVLLTNDIGLGIRDLVERPFQGLAGSGLDPTGQALGLGAAIAAGFTFLSLGGAFFIVIAGLLAVLIALAVFVFRTLLIILLAILAPIAIFCYILPNTQKAWKTWWDWFIKALLVFPIIALMIAIGHVTAKIAYTSDGSIEKIAGLIAYFTPYFLLPLAFKMAGGAMAGIAGGIQRAGSVPQGFIRGRRNAAMAAKWERQSHAAAALAKKPFKNAPTGTRRARVNEMAGNFAAAREAGWGMDPRAWTGAQRKGRVQNAYTQMQIEKMEKAEKEKRSVQMFKVNDGLHDALFHGQGREEDWRSKLRADNPGMSDEDIESKVSLIRQAAHDIGGLDNLKAFSAGTVSGTGSGAAVERDADGNIIGGGVGEIQRRIAMTSKGSSTMQEYLTARARKEGASSGRTDVDTSFGTFISGVRAIDRAQDKQAEAIRQTHAGATSNLESKTAHQILGARGEAVEAHIPAIQQRITTALQNETRDAVNLQQTTTLLDGAIANGASPEIIQRLQDKANAARVKWEQSHRESMQVAAHTSNLLDVAGQTPGRSAQMLSDGVMSAIVNVAVPKYVEQRDTTGKVVGYAVSGEEVKPMSVQQWISSSQADDAFKQTKKVYENESMAARAGGSPPEQPEQPPQ